MIIIDIKNLRLQGEYHHHWLEAHVGMTEVHLEVHLGILESSLGGDES
jgi:hypothetical protein